MSNAEHFFCPRRQLSKGLLFIVIVVQGDFCPWKLLPKVWLKTVRWGKCLLGQLVHWTIIPWTFVATGVDQG